jgi:hypothetical protein
MRHRRHWRHFSHHDVNFDPADLVASIHDIIEAALDAGIDSVHALGDRATWNADEFWREARAFAGRFSEHPSWRSARERANNAWSDTD